LGHVEEIITNDDGIEKLVLKDSQEITADLFIDCTGFKSMLLGGAMQEEFVSCAEKLPVNRTWAVQIPYVDAEKEIQNFTESTALGYGWVWNAPLYSRIGTGYVYSDKFTTPEEALEEFKVYLRKRFGEERINDSLKFNEIKFKSGTYRRTWVKNVVGIGLSSTFLEPLESNGLFFIHESANTLVKFLRRGYVNGIDIDFYNATVRKHFDFFSSFLEYHYVLSQRRDTSFWKYMTERPIEPYLAELPAGGLYQEEQAMKTTQQSYPVVLTSGFHCIAVGHEYYPIDPISLSYWEYHYNTDYKITAANFAIKTEKSQKKWLKAVENAPTHYQYLKENFHNEV
jgi:tryptophan halogenase